MQKLKVSFEDHEVKSKKHMYCLFLCFLSFQRRKIRIKENLNLKKFDTFVLRSCVFKAGF